jgi:acetyl-CoA carboxylase biotin carboxyl carrier protein
MDKTQKGADTPGGGPMSAKIDYEEVRKLIALLEEKNLALFELEVEGFKIKISRATPAPSPSAVVSAAVPAAPSSNPGPGASPAALSHAQAVEAGAGLHYVNSPMVGTFYRRPDPTSDPFVEEGDQVKKGQTLCIIEAMKLMNEIESDIDGTITEVLAENAKPVEFGQRLFGVKPLA